MYEVLFQHKYGSSSGWREGHGSRKMMEEILEQMLQRIRDSQAGSQVEKARRQNEQPEQMNKCTRCCGIASGLKVQGL